MAPRKRKNADIEINELDKIYMDLTGRPAQARSRRKGWIALIVILLLVMLTLSFTLYTACYGNLLDGFLPMNDVTIAGIFMGGTTKREAKALLNMAAQAYVDTPMVIQVLDSTVTLNAADIGISPDMETAVNDAFRSRSTGEFSILPYLRLNLDAVRQAVDALGRQYNTQLVQTQCTVTGDVPSLEPGAEATAQQKSITITLGIPGYGLDTQKLYTQVLTAYSRCIFSVIGACTMVTPELPDLDSLYEAHYIAPVDAVMDGTTFDVTAESLGYGFDLNEAKERLSNLEYGETMVIPFQTLSPDVTAESLRATLYYDVLGICKTPYSGSDSNSRNTNLRLACEAIDGLVLYPGETFSYNHTLGERTAARGYKPAPSYVNGLTVDTYGGGICQVSTTLYYCTLLADLKIVERHPHGYISNYIDPGMDASVNWGSADFRFTNTTDYPIRIEAYRSDGYVFVQLLGTDQKDYYVEMHYSILSTTPYETVYREMEPNNADGYKDGDVIITPYKGYKVNAYKHKYDKVTGKELSKALESVNTYSKRDEVICKITTPEQTDGAVG